MSGDENPGAGAAYALRRVAMLAAGGEIHEAARVLAAMDENRRDKVYELAVHEGLEPLVLAADHELDPSRAKRARSAAGRDLVVDDCIATAAAALGGIDCAFLLEKGAYFRDALYPWTWTRTMVDVDVLVRPADLERAADALSNAGFRAVGPHPTRPVSGRLSLERILVRDRDSISVEVHADLTHERFGFSDDVEGLFRRAVKTRWKGARTLSHEDHLLHAAVHLARSGLDDSLKHYLDVDRMARVWRLDWDTVIGRAGRWGCASALFFVLNTARFLFATPIPDPVISELAPGGPRAWMLKGLLARTEGSADEQGAGWGRSCWKATVLPALYDHPGDRLGYTVWTAITRLADLACQI
ncbi:MAG: nucleotidyltransferase family protein [Deltaproteobacteria bacterium]|nr:nucleotidyltransferase family protein [Deltaproteobacteria bacterium]